MNNKRKSTQKRAYARSARQRQACSPEQTRALNALDEAMFLFNAAIARGE